MRQAILFVLAVLMVSQFSSNAVAQGRELRITGAGASFPFPLYSAWFRQYNRDTPGVRISYQSVGSGAGVRNLINRTVDFGASDAAMTDAEIEQVRGGVVLLPMTAGEIVLTYNLSGVKELRLPREVYPLIFAGEIDRWNDPRIVAANPGVDMPDRPIRVVRRSDSSGTTFVFTQHLSAISDVFRERVGTGTSVVWPSQSHFIGAPRNDGVMTQVNQIDGSIGYVEYFFASRTGSPVALLENRSGEFIAPTEMSGQAALASADLSSDDLRIWVTDPEGPKAYPIVTFTWMLFYREHGNSSIQEALRNFVIWAMDEGQAMAAEMDYIPLPDVIIKRVLDAVPEIR